MKFIESLRLEQGRIFNLGLHQRRLDLTLLAHFGASVGIDLSRELAHRSLPASGLYKLRISYAKEISSIDIDPYARSAVSRIELVGADDLDYRYKYADRSALDALRSRVATGVQPILVQQGFVTDALYANVCFYDGARWLTPERPLLNGTARAAALASGDLVAATIRAEEVAAGRFSKARLINCMNLFDEAADIFLN